MAVGSAPRAQSIQNVSINVDDPRPLASAIAALEKRFGWTVTYEEGPWLCADDARDVTASVRMAQGPTKRPVLVPRGGPYTFARSFAREDGLSAANVLDKLLEDYRSTAYPGVFELARTGDLFHVVRSMSKNREGTLERQRPLLDTPVNVPDANRTAAAMTGAIVAAVGRATATRLDAVYPPSLFHQVQVSGGATNVTARTALVRVLQETGAKLSWRLFCDPGTQGGCTLGIIYR
jgi:hypothetical protein